MQDDFNLPERDVQRTFSNAEFAAALRELADCIEQGRPYELEVDGETVYAPPDALLSVEYEFEEGEAELEFQLYWTAESIGEEDEPESAEEAAPEEPEPAATENDE
jgi:amphi-Trp domain-containing protein